MSPVQIPESSNVSSASHYALQFALKSLKDQCSRSHARIVELERENAALAREKQQYATLEMDLCACRKTIAELTRQKQQFSSHLFKIAEENLRLRNSLTNVVDNAAKDKSPIGRINSKSDSENLINPYNYFDAVDHGPRSHDDTSPQNNIISEPLECADTGLSIPNESLTSSDDSIEVISSVIEKDTGETSENRSISDRLNQMETYKKVLNWLRDHRSFDYAEEDEPSSPANLSSADEFESAHEAQSNTSKRRHSEETDLNDNDTSLVPKPFGSQQLNDSETDMFVTESLETDLSSILRCALDQKLLLEHQSSQLRDVVKSLENREASRSIRSVPDIVSNIPCSKMEVGPALKFRCSTTSDSSFPIQPLRNSQFNYTQFKNQMCYKCYNVLCIALGNNNCMANNMQVGDYPESLNSFEVIY